MAKSGRRRWRRQALGSISAEGEAGQAEGDGDKSSLSTDGEGALDKRELGDDDRAVREDASVDISQAAIKKCNADIRSLGEMQKHRRPLPCHLEWTQDHAGSRHGLVRCVLTGCPLQGRPGRCDNMQRHDCRIQHRGAAGGAARAGIVLGGDVPLEPLRVLCSLLCEDEKEHCLAARWLSNVDEVVAGVIAVEKTSTKSDDPAWLLHMAPNSAFVNWLDALRSTYKDYEESNGWTHHGTDRRSVLVGISPGLIRQWQSRRAGPGAEADSLYAFHCTKKQAWAKNILKDGPDISLAGRHDPGFYGREALCTTYRCSFGGMWSGSGSRSGGGFYGGFCVLLRISAEGARTVAGSPEIYGKPMIAPTVIAAERAYGELLIRDPEQALPLCIFRRRMTT